MIVLERRACAILYNLLRSRPAGRPFLLPANVCPIVPITFAAARRRFVLVDINEATLEIDPDICLDRLHAERGGFGGVLFVRPYGRDRPAEPFFRELKELQPDLLLIDDKCLCRPDWDGSSISCSADVTLFSTGRAKHVDLGYGGFAHFGEWISYRRTMGSYSEAALEEVTHRYERAIAEASPFEGPCDGWLDLRDLPMPWAEYCRRTGEGLRQADDQKRRLNALYAAALPREIQMAPEFQSWRFNIRVPAADRLVERLFAAGLFASRHYASLGGVFGKGHFPVAERLHGEVVNLFNDRYFDDDKAAQAVDCVRRHLAELGGGPAF